VTDEALKAFAERLTTDEDLTKKLVNASSPEGA